MERESVVAVECEGHQEVKKRLEKLPQRRGGAKIVLIVVLIIEVMQKEELNALSKKVIGACIEVHKVMGPGLLEKIYEHCLMKEFQLQNIKAECQVEVPLIYKGYELNRSYAVDILVEKEIVLELKAVETLLPVFDAQLIAYLKLADKRLGFLVNFNVPIVKSGVRRFVNNF